MKQRSLDILKETAFSMRKPDVEVKCIALGMGVQSTAMYLMSSMGLMERADYAVFADPMSEHPETYKLLDWIIEWQEDNNGIPIYTCSNDLYSDILKGVSIRGGVSLLSLYLGRIRYCKDNVPPIIRLMW